MNVERGYLRDLNTRLGVPSLKFASRIACHPERLSSKSEGVEGPAFAFRSRIFERAEIAKQSQSNEDLQLLLNELQILRTSVVSLKWLHTRAGHPERSFPLKTAPGSPSRRLRAPVMENIPGAGGRNAGRAAGAPRAPILALSQRRRRADAGR
jgi:hypothetical protein